MSERYERLDHFLNSPEIDELVSHNYQDEKMAMEADMYEHFKTAVENGWMTEDEAEERFISYRNSLWGTENGTPVRE